MTETGQQFRKDRELNLVITDSGLGGLSICAEIERNFRLAAQYRKIHLTYFNAWPDQTTGYNDLPDLQCRTAVFDRALLRMADFKPDMILIACNTLSVLYRLTRYARMAAVPVLGIIDAGVNLFYEALTADPLGSIVMFGTRITIESGIHRDRLLQMGIQDHRITAISCHGLAAAIDKNPDSPAVAGFVEKCVSDACSAGLPAERLYVGLCCTHYSYVKDLIQVSIERHAGKTMHILDPNHRLAMCVAPTAESRPFDVAHAAINVEVVSKVELHDNQRRAVARRLETVSERTARALLSYTWRPDLF